MILSRCGMRCDLCLVFRPNVEKQDRRAEIVEVFKKTFQGYEADPETIICDGCTSDKENPILLDPECKARKCVLAKQIEHCGYCDNYPCSIFPAEPTEEYLKTKIDVEKQWTWEENKLMEAYQCKKNLDEFRKNLNQEEGKD
ncbi:MAG: DUF3795 domain-containing protein [Eubacterium sp.]|nr:DUF3795 domain-containing protein [Eubacterium sp.]